METNGQHSNGRTTLSQLELRCPPLPQTLMEALELMHRPERLEVRPVTEMVERDPAVVARLLQTVNSAYYGLQRSISSTRRAVVMRGPVAVTGPVVGMNMLKLRSIMEGPAADCFLRLVRHNIAVAYLARHLHDELAPPPPYGFNDDRVGDAFTSGLLHDFGKIILVYNRPEEAVALYEERSIEKAVHEPNIRQMEQLLFGYDHTEAGEFAARKLNFPDVLVDVIARHHHPEALEADGRAGRLLRAVAGANLAAKAMGHAFTKPTEWDACMAHPVWDAILTRDLPEVEHREHLRDALRIEQDSLDAYVAHLSYPTGSLPPRAWPPTRRRPRPRSNGTSDPSENGSSDHSVNGSE